MSKSTKAVMVTTEHRGVFAGLVPADQDMSAETLTLTEARMAVYWGTTRGVHELADKGPNADRSRISSPADIPSLRKITAIFDITDAAWAEWQKGHWA